MRRGPAPVDRRALTPVDEFGLDLTTIRPGFACDPPGDDGPGTCGVVVIRVLNGDVPMLPNLIFDVVDVRDLRDLHTEALTAEAVTGKRVPAPFGTVAAGGLISA